MPTTHASATSGWPSSSPSSSAGATWKPRTLMSSFTRSPMKMLPSSEMRARSPVRRKPSAVKDSRVASGRLR
eukprot:scaffold31695_cov118-Isochrysis_galbana.AAC.4